jgi:hypothetical protein
LKPTFKSERVEEERSFPNPSVCGPLDSSTESWSVHKTNAAEEGVL